MTSRSYTERIVMFVLALIFIPLSACTTTKSADYYFNPDMDFESVKTAAVMPFDNLTREQLASDRVRDVFINVLLSTGKMYVVPAGEVKRGILLSGVTSPASPSKEEIIKLASIMKVDVILTGAVREYGEVRSGASSANIISISIQMIEGQSGKIIWTASSTKGGIGIRDRLLGGGGRPMNDVTEEAVNDILNKYFH